MFTCSRRVTWILLIAGSLLLAVGIISIPIIHQIIRQQITNNVLLVEGSQGYVQWKEPTPPIYLQFWVFDLRNPDEVLQGERPYVEEKGPYTYREYRKKVNITHNANGTVTYRQIQTYYFLRNMSIGWDNETFLSINMPLMTLAIALANEPGVVRVAATLALDICKEELIIRKQVKEIIWGYKDPCLTEAKKIDPEWFSKDVIGFRAGFNGSDDGIYTVHTGEKDINNLGVIDKYNGASSMSCWSTPQANMITGTDGSIGPPFLTKDRDAALFSSDVCRSVTGVFDRDDVSPQGIPVYRYKAPWTELANATVYPPNAGFCTPHDNCMDSGVLNISTCQIFDKFHLPIVVSMPHFYMAAEHYKDAIGNMHPTEQHKTEILIEPTTGLVMKADKRLQLNIFIKKVPEVSQTANIATMVYPVAWLNESVVIDHQNAQKLQNELLLPKMIAQILQIAFISIGAIMSIVTVFLLIARKDDGPRWGRETPESLNQQSRTIQGNESQTNQTVVKGDVTHGDETGSHSNQNQNETTPLLSSNT